MNNDLSRSTVLLDKVQCNVQRTTMTAENLLVYNSCYWQAVETVRKRLPQLYVVSPLAC